MATWYILGFAIEKRMGWQKRWLTAHALNTKIWATPLMIAPRQNARVLLGRSVLVFPYEDQESAPFSPTREGVIHGRVVTPSEASSF